MLNFGCQILLLNFVAALEIVNAGHVAMFNEFLDPVHEYYDPKKCGRVTVMNETAVAQFKVIGGQHAKVGEVPWAVAIYLYRIYHCTGTLISRRHVVTAAHCFAKIAAKKPCNATSGYYQEEVIKKYSVLYGSNCLVRRNKDLCQNSPHMKQSLITRAQHGRFFCSNCRVSDFALLELEDVIDDPFTNYICLPHRHVIRNEDILQLTGYGWGIDASLRGSPVMNNLQLVYFPYILPRAECLQTWKSIANDALCTTESKAASTCLGDSGGGLTAIGPNGQWSLLGVLSYGTDCKELLRGGKGVAQVYIDISLYSQDIDTFTGYGNLVHDVMHTQLLKYSNFSLK